MNCFSWGHSHLFEFTELYIGLNNFQLRKEKPNRNMHIILYQTRLYGTYIFKKNIVDPYAVIKFDDNN